MKVYKIRDKNTGLFSSGHGRRAKWTKKGRTWPSRGSAQVVINCRNKDDEMIKKSRAYFPEAIVDFYKNAEIVEFDLKEV